jgi:hypothetical protein
VRDVQAEASGVSADRCLIARTTEPKPSQKFRPGTRLHGGIGQLPIAPAALSREMRVVDAQGSHLSPDGTLRAG